MRIVPRSSFALAELAAKHQIIMMQVAVEICKTVSAVSRLKLNRIKIIQRKIYVRATSPSAPEQLAFQLEKRSGLATDLQAEIGALQVKVQHLDTHAGDGNERENGGKATTQVAATPLLPTRVKARS